MGPEVKNPTEKQWCIYFRSRKAITQWTRLYTWAIYYGSVRLTNKLHRLSSPEQNGVRWHQTQYKMVIYECQSL